jgi:two-component system chemotaxis response regulator CheY
VTSAPEEGVAAGARPAGAAYNVLVVDDSAVMRAMVIRALRMTGLPLGDVLQASDGAEALRMLDGAWIDIATVDIHMAGMGGQELIDTLRATPETAALPILVISSEASEARIQEVKSRGALFLKKPFEPDGLRSCVLELLGVDDV